jgi:hypothetical protein
VFHIVLNKIHSAFRHLFDVPSYSTNVVLLAPYSICIMPDIAIARFAEYARSIPTTQCWVFLISILAAYLLSCKYLKIYES